MGIYASVTVLLILVELAIEKSMDDRYYQPGIHGSN
jgi:hypothetical protein